MERSEVQDFYKNQTIFITGITGTVGKVLVEKLLRVCPKLNKLYVLIRTRREKSAKQRLEEVFKEPCFVYLKSQRPAFEQQVVPITGDCLKPNLGLSEEDQALLEKDVTIAIHAAALIKFSSSLKDLTYSNVRCLKDMVALSKRMRDLKSFVYISTAYCRGEFPFIEEKFYESRVPAEKLIEIVDNATEEELEVMTPSLVGKSPNLYTFSKAVAEDLFCREAVDLPAAIVRPGVVIPSEREPIPGWCDNFFGLNGIIGGIFLGFTKIILNKKNAVFNVLPSDYAVNIILSVAWNTHLKTNTHKKPKIRIYNATGCNKNLYKYGSLTPIIKKFMYKYPCSNMQLYPQLFATEFPLCHKISLFVLVGIPSYIADFVSRLDGREARAVKTYLQFAKLMEGISYFTLRTWQFETKNVNKLWDKMGPADQKLFYFNMEKIDWDEQLWIAMKGIQTYLYKEPPQNYTEARRRLRNMCVLHYGTLFIMITIVLLFFIYLFYCMY